MYDVETVTFNSDSILYDEIEETVTFNSNSHVYDTGTATVTADARIITLAGIASEYTIPRKIQSTMRNVDTTPQAGGQGRVGGGFRIL